MEPSTTLSWRAPEHPHVERSSDWFWALGIIAASSAVTSLLFGNVLFALLIVVAASTLTLLAKRHPEEVEFELTDRALRVGDESYPYDQMHAFWITDEEEPKLLIDTPRIMTPDLVIPLVDVDPDTIREVLIEMGVPEAELHEPAFYRIFDFFGF